MKTNKKMESKNKSTENFRCIDLEYLYTRTNSDPKLMVQLINLYLDQTLPLLEIIRNSLDQKNWQSLATATHKILPSFLIMGINSEYEEMAKKVQAYALKETDNENLHFMVQKIEIVCKQACEELNLELMKLNNNN